MRQGVRAAVVLLAAALTACGSTSTAAIATPSPSPIPSVKITAAPRSCPTAARVNAALGTNVAAPVGVAGAGSTQLPPGAKGQACEYAGKSENVIIILVTNISPSYISSFSDRFPVPYTSVSGVGDQARAFRQQLDNGDNEGVVATRGTTLVSITATRTPASLPEVEALVGQLL